MPIASRMTPSRLDDRDAGVAFGAEAARGPPRGRETRSAARTTSTTVIRATAIVVRVSLGRHGRQTPFDPVPENDETRLGERVA